VRLVLQAPFFAAPVTLGKDGIEFVHELGPLSHYEKELVDKAVPDLIAQVSVATMSSAVHVAGADAMLALLILILYEYSSISNLLQAQKGIDFVRNKAAAPAAK